MHQLPDRAIRDMLKFNKMCFVEFCFSNFKFDKVKICVEFLGKFDKTLTC